MIVSSLQTKSIALLARVFTSCYRPGMCVTFIVYPVLRPGIFIWENLLRYWSWMRDGQVKLTCLGPDLLNDQKLQYTLPPNVWFAANPTKDFHILTEGVVAKNEPRDAESHYSLVGCTCAPAFQFQDFELAKRSELITRFPKQSISFLTHLPE
ncbi:uncharacterized protein LOC120156913 [Hibiscus syriacus]|nr:uncharacterized protein LOC120156913 [Hibiscus syriacus]